METNFDANGMLLFYLTLSIVFLGFVLLIIFGKDNKKSSKAKKTTTS